MPNISEQSLEGIAFIINNCKLLTIFQEFSKNQSKLLTFISQSIETQWRVCARNGTQKIAPWKIVPQKIAPYSNPNYNLNPNPEGNLPGAVLRGEIFMSRGQTINNCFCESSKIWSPDKSKNYNTKKEIWAEDNI